MDCKKIFLSLAVVLAIAETNAQTVTQDMGNNVKVTYDQSLTGPYKMTWSVKSRNGGSVTQTWGGQLQNGKRTGLWKGSATYTNFEMSDGLFWQGTSSITRNYADGKPSGFYSVIENTKVRNGRYNTIRRVWEYGQWHDQSNKITGTFKDGRAVGSWSISCQKPKENITVTFNSDGRPTGTYRFNEFSAICKDGYLIGLTEPKDATWGYKLVYTPEEIAAFTPEKAEKTTFTISNYDEWYLIGAQWENEVKNYPKNSSDEPNNFGELMIVNYYGHLQIYGNPAEYQIAEFEYMKRKNIEKHRIDSIKAVEEPMVKLATDSLSKYNQHDISFTQTPVFNLCRDYAELQKILPLHEKHPELATYVFKGETRINDNIYFESYKELIANKSDIENKYQNILSKNIQEVMKYGLSEKEAEMYVLKNYGVIKQEVYIGQLLEIYKKIVLKYCSETPVTWSDVQEYYTYHTYDKKTISLDSVKKFRDNWFLYATAEEYQPIPVKYGAGYYYNYLKEVTEFVSYTRDEKEWEKIEKQVRKLYPELK